MSQCELAQNKGNDKITSIKNHDQNKTIVGISAENYKEVKIKFRDIKD